MGLYWFLTGPLGVNRDRDTVQVPPPATMTGSRPPPRHHTSR